MTATSPAQASPLPAPVDHVLVTGPGPSYAPVAEFEVEKARREVEAHLLLPIEVRHARNKVRAAGTLLGATFDIDGGRQLV